MGDTVRSDDRVGFKASVLGAGSVTDPGGAFQLLVIKDGVPFAAFPVTGDRFETTFQSDGPGRYRLQLQRGSTIEGVSSPIYVEPAQSARAPAGAGAGDPSRSGDPGTRNGGGGGDRRTANAGSGSPAAGGSLEADRDGELPFTGRELAVLPPVAVALLATGVALRRRLRRS